MQKSHTKPLPTLKESLTIEKNTGKICTPKNKSGTTIPKVPELLYFDEVSEFLYWTRTRLNNEV